MIGAVAAIGTSVGAGSLIQGALDSTVQKVIPLSFRAPLLVFGVVFVSDFVYNMFLQ
jgi:hypothetical protein